MDDIWDINKLALFIAFVVPGFISLKTYELRCPRETKSSSEQLIDAIAYSSLNYGLFLGAIYLVEQSTLSVAHPTLYILFYVAVLLLGPVLWPLLWFKLRTTEFVQKIFPTHPTGKPWDWLFQQKKAYWVVVHFKDGRKAGGLYSNKSFASSAPEAEQIYLEKAYLINDDGILERPLTGTAGVLIVGEIASVELFHIDGESNGEREREQGPGQPRRPREGISAPETRVRQSAGGLPAGEGPRPDRPHSP